MAPQKAVRTTAQIANSRRFVLYSIGEILQDTRDAPCIRNDHQVGGLLTGRPHPIGHEGAGGHKESQQTRPDFPHRFLLLSRNRLASNFPSESSMPVPYVVSPPPFRMDWSLRNIAGFPDALFMYQDPCHCEID